ncbi:MAG: hypothetical protein EU544_02610, partial [Promethearchaeota archaeon]
MYYIFKILVLGYDPQTPYNYICRAFKEEGNDMGSYREWYKEFQVMDNKCDLEVNVITDTISADFDEIIPSVDGIVYFLNPQLDEEVDLFNMVIPIINSVKRDIPTIIMYYDKDGILPISTNKLLEDVWINFPNFEAFVNLPSQDFHQVIECLCLALIQGDTPINIENSWLRYPLFIKLANLYYQHQQYYNAAIALKKAATVSEIYNREEYTILYEQAAYLFSKLSLYLEASEIMQKVNKKKAKNFKKLYAETIIREGNKLFNKNEFETAAKQYETAAQWASIELKDKNLIQEAFRLAINSWISACKVNNAFNILERLPHEEVLSALNDVSKKIIAATDYLVLVGNLEHAKDQLYTSINTYQKEGLFDIIDPFASKLVEILIELLKNEIEENELYRAKDTYDQIENLWESFDIKRVNIDAVLENLIKKFIEDLNFGMASVLINKLNSLDKKQKLTEIISDREEKEKDLKKAKVEQNLQKGVDFLKRYVNYEEEIIIDLNSVKLKEANQLFEQGNILEAANLLEDHSLYLRKLKKDEIADQILTKSLDMLIKGQFFKKFFVYYHQLTGSAEKKYLKRSFPIYLHNLKKLIERQDQDFVAQQKVFENSNKIYRNQMLYEESKQISEVYIDLIKKEALRIINEQQNLAGIQQAN